MWRKEPQGMSLWDFESFERGEGDVVMSSLRSLSALHKSEAVVARQEESPDVLNVHHASFEEVGLSLRIFRLELTCREPARTPSTLTMRHSRDQRYQLSYQRNTNTAYGRSPYPRIEGGHVVWKEGFEEKARQVGRHGREGVPYPKWTCRSKFRSPSLPRLPVLISGPLIL
eukprot:TRINITY_DN38537_c0_g1_i1.p1 TRINITY_DN38537_c0_g1~~TRINITY_DN38537_c0_g1_i1.p1  ORF type:complete len:171 (+),score=2.46 TRINITY_DN38537_c0_g1_i1:546-1058(+)